MLPLIRQNQPNYSEMKIESNLVHLRGGHHLHLKSYYDGMRMVCNETKQMRGHLSDILYAETLEDGFDATSHNQSVISIGGYHAKQSSRYQSFNIGDEYNEYNFTQLSTYSPNAKHNKDNENRIATIKEMLSTQHQHSLCSSSTDNDEDIQDIYNHN